MFTSDSPGPSPDTLTCPGPRTLHVDLNSGALDVSGLESILENTNGVETVRFCHDRESKQPEELSGLIRIARNFCRVVELFSSLDSFPLHRIGDLISSGLDSMWVTVPVGHGLDDLRLRLSAVRSLQRELAVRKPQLGFVCEITAGNSAGLRQVAELAGDFGVEEIVVHSAQAQSEDTLCDTLPDLLAAIQRDYPAICIDASTCEDDLRYPLSAHPRFTGRAVAGRERIFSCLESPWDSTRVLPNGDVVTCARRKHLALGNLSREPMREIWRNVSYEEFREQFPLGNDSECRRCPRKRAHLPAPLRSTLRPEDGNTIEFVDGWHWSDGQIVWSKSRSRCLLGSGPGRQDAGYRSVELVGLLPAGSAAHPNELTVSHRGKKLAAFRNPSTTTQAFRLLFSFFDSSACAQFEFTASHPHLPMESGSRDRRELGFALVGLRSIVPPDRRLARWRCVPLYLALAAGRHAARFMQRFSRPYTLRKTRGWRPGISIVIPECGTPELLRRALSSAGEACARLAADQGETSEIIVVVNGAALDLYAECRREFPTVRWVHSEKMLGFGGAIEKGLSRAQFDWVYLLNSDATLDVDALREVARWRAPHVFAVSSQVFFADPERRREETGWTNFAPGNDGASGLWELFDAIPEDDSTVRGNLYAGGGNSLFRRDLLRRYLPCSKRYHPAYWEDVEWGVRAWREGYEVLFCPTSRVVHVHRATVTRLFSPRELDRIWQRNQLLFSMRNGFNDLPARTTIGNLRSAFDLDTQYELTTLRQVISMFRAVVWNARAPMREVDLSRVCRKYYLRPGGGRPVALFVSPFAVYPVAHGGARRIANLIAQMSGTFDIVLLTDEESTYRTEHIAAADGPVSIHMTGGRVDATVPPTDRISRIRAHSHSKLGVEMDRLASSWNAALIQVEYMELAALIGQKRQIARYVLDLHDVLLSEGAPTEEDRYEQALIARYDAVIACSSEDAKLVAHERVDVVPNGFVQRSREYRPSRGSRMLLFAGPFRYAPNLAGIRRFLEQVYPELRQAVHGLEMTILGGHGSRAIAERYPCFDQPGIELVDRAVDPEPWFERSALTINPVADVRGSCVKVIESIAFGRVCVSTLAGTRGFSDLKARSLIAVPGVEDFEAPLRRLLLDEDLRMSLERPDHDALSDLSWENIGRRQRLLYDQWFGRGWEGS